MNKYYIYTLEYNNRVFYIGKSLDPNYRLRKHKNESKLKRTHKEKLINKIIISGGDIELKILDVVDLGYEDYWEKFWIQQFKQWGFKLCNATSGGEGGDFWTGRKHSEETKEKLRIIRNEQIKNGKIYRLLGESNGRSKLNNSKVIEIRKLRETGYSYGKIALKFCISKAVVISIIKRKTWKHI